MKTRIVVGIPLAGLSLALLAGVFFLGTYGSVACSDTGIIDT